MSNTAKLTLQMTDTGFDKAGTDLRTLATEATKANTGLKTTASSVDQVSKSTTSLGSKLKAAGSSFAQIGTAASTTVLSVVSLQRSYRDLEDSQIAVDKSTRRVSLAQEAYKKATDGVAKAIATSGKGSKAYQQAILDQKQALDKLNISIKDQGEAVERQGDINQDFFLSLGTTALATSSTVVGALEKIGGDKGLGGILSKIKSLGSGGFGGLSGLTAALGPLALAAAAAAVAIIAYDNAMKKVAAAQSEFTAAKGAKTLADELDHMKKGFDALKLKPGTNVIDFFSSLGAGGLQNTFVKMAEDAKTKEIELKTETEALTTAKEKLNKALADPALKSHVTTVADAAKKTLTLAQAEVTRLETIEKTIPASEKLSSSMAAANRAMGANTTLLDTMTKPFTGNSVFYTMAQNVDQLKASFIALNQEADRSQFMKLLSGGNPSATTTVGPSITEMKAKLTEVAGIVRDQFTERSSLVADIVTRSKEANDKIVANEKAAALATQQAWDKAFNAQTSGIDKILAAWDKLHPDVTKTGKDKKGKDISRTKTFALPVEQAQDFITKFEAGLAPLLASPKSAQTYAINWVNTAAQKMGGVAGKLIQPITEYIKAHSSEPPQEFMSGFAQFLSTWNPSATLGQTFFKPIVTVANDTGKTAATGVTTELGKIKIPDPAITKMKAQAAKLIADMTKKPAIIKIDANLAQANAKWNAFVKKVRMTTLQVKIAGTSVNIRSGSQAGAYGGPHAGGFSGIVRRPTLMEVGEGGREERVSVTPIGSTGHSGDTGSGPTIVNVYNYLDGEQITSRTRYRITKGSSVVK
jgi:hypothetical protein